jgi:hypothetical protein
MICVDLIASIDADNVGDKVAAWMVEIIQTTAGLVQQDDA